jgi:hypothetical protein
MWLAGGEEGGGGGKVVGGLCSTFEDHCAPTLGRKVMQRKHSTNPTSVSLYPFRSFFLCGVGICNGIAPITVTNGQLMHVEELKLMLAPESPNLVEMVSKRKMQRLRLYMYPECRKAALAAFFLTGAFCDPFTHQLPSIQCRHRNSVILGQGLSLLLQPLWYVATFCLLQLTYLFKHTSYNAKN